MSPKDSNLEKERREKGVRKKNFNRFVLFYIRHESFVAQLPSGVGNKTDFSYCDIWKLGEKWG